MARGGAHTLCKFTKFSSADKGLPKFFEKKHQFGIVSGKYFLTFAKKNVNLRRIKNILTTHEFMKREFLFTIAGILLTAIPTEARPTLNSDVAQKKYSTWFQVEIDGGVFVNNDYSELGDRREFENFFATVNGFVSNSVSLGFGVGLTHIGRPAFNYNPLFINCRWYPLRSHREWWLNGRFGISTFGGFSFNNCIVSAQAGYKFFSYKRLKLNATVGYQLLSAKTDKERGWENWTRMHGLFGGISVEF